MTVTSRNSGITAIDVIWEALVHNFFWERDEFNKGMSFEGRYKTNI